MGLILLIVLIALMLGAVPRWNYSRQWGYGPSGLLSVILVLFVCLLLFDVIHWRTLQTNY